MNSKMSVSVQEFESTSIALLNSIDERILIIRGLKVMMDVDLAELYGVTTKRLNEQVKRNKDRFPSDFMFQLTKMEKDEVVANCDHLSKLKFSPYLPHVFTEHGAIMAATVLNTGRAIGVSLYVVRAFVKLREMYREKEELETRLDELDKKVSEHDESIKSLIVAIRKLTSSPGLTEKRRIGFYSDFSSITKEE